MAWTPPAEEEKKPTGTSWTPPENEVKKIWTPPAEDDPENPVNEKEPWRLKKLKESGVALSEEQEKLLWKYEEDRPLLDKAGEAVRTFFPAAAKVANQLGTGSVDLIYKGVLKPIDAMSQTPEEAEKTFKEAGNAWRSFGSGAMSDMEETIDMATRFSMFGSGITDKLQGLPEEERFKRFKNREVMRQFGQAVREEMPDRAAALISENPFLKKAAGAYAKLSGGTPEEVKMAEEAFTELVKESGLTKEELDENISMLGEFMSPVALPGGNRITGAIAKPVGKVVQKTGELALRGIKPIAGAVEGAAELTLKGTELVQGGARKIGEYTTNDPDTLLRTGANTVVMPINAVAKPTSNVARVVKDVTSQVDVGGAAGRRGLFERAGRAETSSDLTRRLFGPQGKGGVARAKVADWTVRQANAIIQPGVNGAALNVLMGLPDIETAAQLGEVAGTGFGIGGFAGARVFDRAGAIIDPTTSLAEKITTVVTPDMAQRRLDEDADIKRFLATATPEMKSQMADLSNIDKRKTAIDSKLINLRQQKERTINAANEANLQRQIDGFEKQRQALEKATPQTVREAERQVQLAFMDAMDLAQATGTSAGLRGLNLTVLNADNADGFFRNLYGGAVERAEGVVNLLTGRTDLTMQESQNLQQARELLNRFSTEVAGAKNQRGFAIGVDGTDPNAEGYVPPHLRKVNQTGATAVINGDLVKHLSEQGFDVRRVINHEMQHALQQFREVKDMLSPIRGDLFDQKVVKDDGTVEVWKQGIFSDADIARYGANYAAKMSPADNGASFIAQFQDVDAFNAYIKDEILAEVASQTGDYSNGTRAALDDVGRNLVDWLEVKTKAGALRKMKEGLRNFGIVFDNYGGYSNVLGADLPPEALAMIRQYQRQLRDFDGSMQIQTTREEDAPDIPMTAILGSRALQEKYKDADFFEKEQILRSTAPDGTVTEIVMPKGAKLDPFVDIYRIQGGQLVDANGNPVQLPPEITFGSLPEGSTFQMDTRIARKPDGSPITLSAREIKSRALERTQSIRNVIDSAPDDGTPNRLIDTGNGNYRGVMSPSQLAAVLSIPNNVLAPALKRQIQFFNELMQRGDGTRAIFEYQAALLNGKYKAIAPKIRDEVPIGWQFTKDGNFALTTISVSRLYDKLQAWADQGTVTQEQTWTGELIPVKRSKNLALWNGDTNKFWNSLVQVLDNHANGREGWVGLHSDELTAKRMRNKVNDLFNVFNKETKEMNPDRSTLPRVRGRDNVDIIVRSRRVDRINSFSESPSTKVPVNYGKLLINYMPETNPLAAPQTPEQFMENINGSVSATRIRNAIATGAVDQLEAELRNSDDLLPTESLFVSQGEGGDPLIQVTSMLDPNVEGALEPEEVVVDLDARTAAELARLEAEEAAAMAAQQQAQAPVEPAPAPEPAPEPVPTPTTQFMPAEAPSGERGFQSKLQLEIQKKFKGASATPEQLKAVLGNPQNVKPEEVKWSGVMDEIDRLAQENNGKVPVQELLNYLRNEGQVKFEEVTFGENRSIEDVADRYRIKIEKQFGEAAFYDEFDEPLEFDELPVPLQEAIDKADKRPEPKYAQYQLPGGENYREVVLSMPETTDPNEMRSIVASGENIIIRGESLNWKDAVNKYIGGTEGNVLIKTLDKLDADQRNRYIERELVPDIRIKLGAVKEQYQPFTSIHFPEAPNYIAHMRVNERTDAEGNPGLFVEEFQSDRHQQGREKGYVGEREMPEGYELIDENQSAREAGYDVPSDAPPRWRFNSSDTFSRIYNSRQEAIDAAWKNDSYSGESRIPDAPFRKDWGVQLFKRALRDAVESGKKWIGWTTGDTQAERYKLSKQVDSVVVILDGENTYALTAYKNGRSQVNEEKIPEAKLSEFIGKELAIQAIEKIKSSEQPSLASAEFEGLDLDVGGEGMKGFYDQILPKEIGKYVAKMGGKVEKSSLTPENKTIAWAFEDDDGVFRVRNKTDGKDPNAKILGEFSTADEAVDFARKYRMDGTPIWRVNITPEMENVVRAGQIQFMPAESDAEYLAAVERGDMETAQRMVDEAAKSLGYSERLYRGFRTKPNPDEFELTSGRETISLTPVKEVANLYSHEQIGFGGIKKTKQSTVHEFYVDTKNLVDLRDIGTRASLEDIINEANLSWNFYPEKIVKKNYPSGRDARGKKGRKLFTVNELIELLEELDSIGGANAEIDVGSGDGFVFGDLQEAADYLSDLQFEWDETKDPDGEDFAEAVGRILYDITLDVYRVADTGAFKDALMEDNIQGIIHKDTVEAGADYFVIESVAGRPIEKVQGIDVDDDYSHDTYRVFSMNQMKLADPITRDNEGNVIPLSQRFQTTSPDIRFMPEEQGPLADIQAPEQRGEQKVLAEIELPEKPITQQQEVPVAKSEADAEEEVSDTELRSTGIEVPESVDEQSVISNAIKVANSQSWKKGRDFKMDLQRRVMEAAEKAGVTISERTVEAIEYLSRVGLKDALIALEQNPNAIGWYDEKTKQALGVMSLLFPEIATDENARFAFTWALAVTSNGLKVDKNFELAERVYRQYRKTGKMPTNIEAGQAQKAINEGLDLFNKLTKEWGVDNTRKFMQTDFTVGEISRLSKDLSPGGEFADTNVRGSAILGPKIGNGFFSNLYGLFDALTMDRWLIRTWGRWTGTLVELNPELTKQATDRLQEAVQKLTPEDKERMDQIIKQDISQMSLEDLSVAIQKASMKPELRELMNQTETGEEFRKSGNGLAKYLDGQKEAPSGPTERNFIREIFGLMLDELKSDPKYASLTMADLQAVLWYAEKRLYETAKIKADQDSLDSSDADGYEDDEAPDYANAAIGVARKKGISQKRIDEILEKIKNDRTTTTRPETQEGSGDQAEQQDGAGGFTGKEKQKFKQYVAVTTARRNRKGNEKALWTYARKGGIDSSDAGVLKPKSKKNLGIKYISEWKPGRKLATMFRNNGIPPVKFLELDSTDKVSAKKFADTLQQSKNASVNGASVYVYPVEDYQGMKLFLSESGKSGFALKPDGDIVSVFSMDKGSGRSIMETAIAAGGRKLDAFDTILPEFYGTHGFVEAARIPWNDEFAPEGWDKATFKEFNDGEPDVVMMVFDPKFEGEYEPRTDIYATDYDQAIEMQNSLLKKLNKGVKKK